MKTVTKEEVERVALKHINGVIVDKILNELFQHKFNVGDWVTVDSIEMYDENRNFNFHSTDFKGKDTFKIGSVFNNYVCETSNDEGNGVKNNRIRHATPEEIAAVEWEEGKPYKVWIDNGWAIRISSGKTGFFYVYGYFEGATEKFNKYEKL